MQRTGQEGCLSLKLSETDLQVLRELACITGSGLPPSQPHPGKTGGAAGVATWENTALCGRTWMNGFPMGPAYPDPCKVPHGEPRKNLLSDRHSTKMSTNCIMPFISNSGKCKLIYSARKQVSVAWGGGGTGKRDQ